MFNRARVDAATHSRRLAIIPVVILLIVAAVQIYLARTADLTPWKGGGFGMFSTTDSVANRFLRVYGSGPDHSEELLLEGKLVDLAAKVQAFPNRVLLEKLGKAIFRDRRFMEMGMDAVRIEVWKAEYNKEDLRPTVRMLQRFEYKTNGNRSR